MSRRIFALLPRPALLTAAYAIVPGGGPVLRGSPGFRPVIARPQIARHGGGGGHGGGGHGWGGHNPGGTGSGFPDSSGSGWHGGGRTAVIYMAVSLILLIVVLVLRAQHEYAAIVVILAVIFGVPVAGAAALFLLLVVMRVFSWRKQSLNGALDPHDPRHGTDSSTTSSPLAAARWSPGGADPGGASEVTLTDEVLAALAAAPQDKLAAAPWLHGREAKSSMARPTPKS